jgi:putative membrane protein
MVLFADEPNWQQFGQNVLAAGVFGILGIVLLVFGFKVFDWIWPKIDVEKELQEKNMAVAVVIAAVLIAIGLIVHASVHG